MTDYAVLTDNDAAEGRIMFSVEFLTVDPLYKKDLIQDWIAQLNEVYESFNIFGEQNEN